MKKYLTIGVFIAFALSFSHTDAASYPAGCNATTAYSSITGRSCSSLSRTDCGTGDTYSSFTGQPCATYIPGCTSKVGFSPTSGKKCDGSVPVSVVQPYVSAPAVIDNSYQVLVLSSQYKMLEGQAMGYSDYQFYRDTDSLPNLSAPDLEGRQQGSQELYNILAAMQGLKMQIQYLGGSVK